MSHNNERSLDTLKNESTRQRWELFHRAIAFAKQSNTTAMQEASRAQDAGEPGTKTGDEADRAEPQLSIAR